MTVLDQRTDNETIATMPLGVGAMPIDHDVINACGDCYLWAELDELFAVRLTSL